MFIVGQTIQSRCCADVIFLVPHKIVPTPLFAPPIFPFIGFTVPLFNPTSALMLIPFAESPLFLQLNEASNESVGLADAAGDELEPVLKNSEIVFCLSVFYPIYFYLKKIFTYQ